MKLCGFCGLMVSNTKMLFSSEVIDCYTIKAGDAFDMLQGLLE
jgi:hypothetical protein